MDNMEYIEDYFKGLKDEAQKQQFEKKIMEDASFADEVAFYISANGILQQQQQDEKKERFRELYGQHKVISMKEPVRMIWRYMAAASVLIAVISVTWFSMRNTVSPQQMADNYFQKNYKTLSGEMGSRDSLQIAIDLYNNDKSTAALNIFEAIVKNGPGNNKAKEFAGLAALRTEDYDKALEYFTMLENETLQVNPGKFYKATTLLKRNKPGDEEAAKKLLHEIIENNLSHKEEAKQWLDKMK